MYPGTHAKTQPERLAIIQPSSGLALSYRELDEQSNQLAQLLYAQGLRRGDHLALFLENHPRFLVVLWACLRSGLYFTPINRHLSAAEAAYIVDDCDARVLVASAALEQSEELGRLAPRCELKLAIGGAVPGFTDYDTATAQQSTQALAEEHMGTLMLYSSGTTGRPKGIKRPLPEGRPEAGNPSTLFAAKMFNMDSETVYLAPAPMYHAAPLGYSNAALVSGGTVVMMDKFEPELSLQLIEQYRVTHSQWVPTMFIRLLRLPDAVRERYDLSSLRYAIHAAAPCPVEVKRRMIEWWGPVIEEYYSSTEAAGYTRISSEEWLAHPGSVGRPVGRPFHICDEAGNELPAGEPGMIYAEMTPGAEVTYHKDPGKSADARHPRHEDWLCVGDVGYLDDQGYLYLTDRKSFMIISGGVNIYPQQIEDALALYPGIEDVAVIGVPNEDLGEEARALVQLAPGSEGSDALAEQIQEFVRARLGKQLVPRSVEFVAALPRMPTGKLNKKALRERYWPAPVRG
ncbi:acyl-CoA synthetase [Mangrovimicrobium sediminis]|uniref:Acyl-CoA synthetase n=1 Tax=Mangrovimicrobium sediminis TaxID=2562682 RepID=A0A4Z0LVB3_9GAMM|nr:acyl-CoA synthetase [Haliea sp. SAOS-164]TGD71262.1 acyl-CoA synthetase [Haliea sp. SAOS-164]